MHNDEDPYTITTIVHDGTNETVAIRRIPADEFREIAYQDGPDTPRALAEYALGRDFNAVEYIVSLNVSFD